MASVFLALSLLIFVIKTKGDDCGSFVTDSTVNNIKFTSPSVTYYNMTVKECTKQCMDLAGNNSDACVSYGYQTYQHECYIYNQYASVGDASEPSDGLVFFWTYSRPCPSDYTLIKDGGFCVKFYYTHHNWIDAREVCRQDGGHLLILNKESKREFVRASYNQDAVYYAWIGATDEHDEDNWRWADGTDVNKFWKSGEPNGYRGENCLEIRNTPTDNVPFYHQFNDQPCEFQNQFICEVPQNIFDDN